MLYDSDITGLISQWQERLHDSQLEPSYNDALNDCIYDLQCLIDRHYAEEALAHESYCQKLMDDGQWDEWFDALISDETYLIPQFNDVWHS